MTRLYSYFASPEQLVHGLCPSVRVLKRIGSVNLYEKYFDILRFGRYCVVRGQDASFSEFAIASAVAADQLQQAQHPYDAKEIQSADAKMVAELTKLSDHNWRFAKDPVDTAKSVVVGSAVLAEHADEQHNCRPGKK
ncbi:hypothetical protein OsI_08220 [Oryza sativa Indica Group]|uniref:DUF641 domain-containing protein n=1 Tax=Oryza sativa subsp. indica TaxID=39946 RepID=B8AFU9_ORYSI|nr:hypothetical protein OsI_08220 [Oryza sativa Indica Group]